jgi:magnesium-transporting ATPase (P-type)
LVSLLIGGATIAVFLIEKRMGMPLDLARTVAVNTLVAGEIFYLFNSRLLGASSLRLDYLFTNHAAWLSIAVLTALQIGFVYLPFMQRWFGTAPLDLRHWLVPPGIGLTVFLIIEAEKALLRYLESKNVIRRAA